MKDKYFGDIHDYLKYALLRYLQQEMGWSIFINWMLTTYEPQMSKEGKQQCDGEKIEYENIKEIDPLLFDALRPFRLGIKPREVGAFKGLSLLNNFDEYRAIVPDKTMSTDLSKSRKEWSEGFLTPSKNYNLVFFDPDNGLRVKSTSLGRANSYKYVFEDEIQEVFKRGQNVLIYQHRNRQNYDTQLDEKKILLCKNGEKARFFVFNGKKTFFLLMTTSNITDITEKHLCQLTKEWNQRLSVL